MNQFCELVFHQLRPNFDKQINQNHTKSLPIWESVNNHNKTKLFFIINKVKYIKIEYYFLYLKLKMIIKQNFPWYQDIFNFKIIQI